MLNAISNYESYKAEAKSILESQAPGVAKEFLKSVTLGVCAGLITRYIIKLYNEI